MVLTQLKFLNTFHDIFAVNLEFGQNEVEENPRLYHFEVEIVFWLLLKSMNPFFEEKDFILVSDYFNEGSDVFFEHPAFFGAY